MARRPIEKRLSQELVQSEFVFLGYGPINILQVYARVKTQYPEFCDDEYMCSEHCTKGTKGQPEWKHVVRSDMQKMKKRGLAHRTGNRWEWVFMPRV